MRGTHDSGLGLFPTAAGLGLSLVVALSAGCAGRTPELVQPVGETHTNASSTGGARPQGEDSASQSVRVVIGPEVRSACGMTDAPDDALPDAAQYAFAAGQLRPHGADPLKRLATCVASGKLGKGPLRVIGYADPRGAGSYAYQLGTYRATGGKQHLVDLGVPANKLIVESRGNADAKGNDDASWSLDRRVEIHLVDSGPPPLNEPAPNEESGR